MNDPLETGLASRPIQPPATNRLYLEDSYCFEAEASVEAVRDNRVAFDQTCFYPGGGQPPMKALQKYRAGRRSKSDRSRRTTTKSFGKSSPPVDIAGQPARLIINRDRRIALRRHHTSLHVLNTIALRDFGGWITGVQIGADHSRIDFKIEGFSPALVAELEKRVNAVFAENHSVAAYCLSKEEFRKRLFPEGD